MNLLFFLLAFLVGLSVVVQGTVNGRIAADWGINWTVFINAIVFLIISFIIVIFAKFFPDLFPEYLKLREIQTEKLGWWYLIPGLCGVMIVLGIPWAISINGPSKTFIILIASQIVLGLLYEKFFQGAAVSPMKWLGAGIAMAGTALVMVSP